MGLPSFESPLCRSIAKPQLSAPRGPSQVGVQYCNRMTAIVVHVYCTQLTMNVEGGRAWTGDKYKKASVSTGSLSRGNQPCSSGACRALGSVDSKDSLLGANQIQGCF